MNYELAPFYAEKLSFDILCPRPIKMIKVTSEFANYLAAKYKPEMLYKKNDMVNGYYGNFTGTPIVVDNTILSDYYELIF